MENDDILDKQKFIFGSIFVLANRLQAIGDRRLGEYGLTAKQWLLTAVIGKFGDNPPTLNEVAETMGSSHQNVKQIALKLQEKDFLRIEKDERDSRALRLKLTEQSDRFWKNRQAEDERFVRDLFKNLSGEEIEAMFHGLNQLYQAIQKL